MKFKTFPKDVIVELLLFLAENESFESIRKGFDRGITPGEVREVLLEVADYFRRDLGGEEEAFLERDSYEKYLSKNSLAVLEALLPQEKQMILKGFGLARD
ncbi:MAG: hypothetical protein A3I75_01145 [Deltaproteobacteria bacterium RIFCSPLOWO2_02_FULL_50_16]|nr:MAG: hypothetical protein A2053_06530 [Deltaproteobacteria bacterium GWA2_50_8]OGQ26013.1 MAG: hypothetical protein A3B79_03315 [Deltaproteobacteria bacterium RIFCSPHIGHO2_02_FULL_50_15]OGQ58370.1 MAG: hypothetical protein A3I75_01145 [Deltaproteobacteria bacterium RIFCSPLOWO2_02_FULL_50_16]OGQ68512.1 MAG: hypothetical protein A3F89_00365 [Deltaproteobacteria bacterium RIFCSPLOWO2_12_FULL_50_11]